MKKTLLTLALALAFVVLLAMSVFAEDIIVSQKESEEYGTVIQLSADPGLDNAKQYVSTLKKINDTGDSSQDYCVVTDGTYFYVFPSSYFVLERADGKFELYAGTDSQPGIAQAMAEFNAAMGTEYYDGYVVGGGTYANRRIDAIVRFEFPSDVSLVHQDWCCMRSYSSLVEVRINHPLKAGNGMFQSSSKLKTVIGFENVDATSIGKQIFMGCSALEYVKFPVDTVRIPDSSFWGCRSLKTIANMNELTKLTNIGASAFQDALFVDMILPDSVTTIEHNAFQSAIKEGVGSLTINPTSNLTTIEYDAFRDCRVLTSLYIPSTVTSIGSNAFRQTHSLTVLENFENCQITELAENLFCDATKIATLKLPATLTKIGNAFHNNEKLTLVYIPDTVTDMADTFTGSQPKSALYIYIGRDKSAISACARLNNATVISAEDYMKDSTYTGVSLVLGYSYCLAYNNGTHMERETDTVVTTYLDEIKIVSKCTLCGMGDDTGRIPALFEYLGFSADESGKAGFIIGFVANVEAIKQYKEISGKTLEYGVFVATQNAIGNDDIFTSNGKTKDGVVGIKTSDSPFALFQLKVLGFREDQKNVKLSLGAYIKVIDGESTEYVYLQDKAPDENQKYHFASYNEIINSTK